MTSPTPRRRGAHRAWPYWAVASSLVLLILVYLLVFLTGSRTPTPKLGIDLQGGTRVTLVPQGQQPSQDQLRQARLILENRVNGMGVSGAGVVIDGDSLVITVPGGDSSEVRELGQTSQLLFRPVAASAGSPDATQIRQVTEDMANRWVELGVLTTDKANELLASAHTSWVSGQEQQNAQLEAAGTPVDPAENIDFGEVPTVTAKEPGEPANSIVAAERRAEVLTEMQSSRQSDDATTIYASAYLTTCEAGETDPIAGNDDPAKQLVACDRANGAPMLLDPAPVLVGQETAENPSRLSGAQIDTGSPITGGYNTQTGEMEISFKFSTANGGGDTWSQLTQQYQGQQVAITLDSDIISAPTIEEATPVGQSTRITGSFTEAEAQALANNLRYGALPLSFAGADGEPGGTVTSVPPSMGAASLKAGLIAGAVGLLLVLVYALWYSRLLGLLAMVSLTVSGLMVYGVLILLGRWIGYSLDLAGIAGIIIGIGTTADSFVVFFERIKDETREGRTFRSAVPRAWERSRRTIWSGNVVSLIAAAVLYILAIGEVRGFAFTLGLTTVFDLVTAFLVTAPLIILSSRARGMSNPAWTGLASVIKVAERRRAEGEHLPGDAPWTAAAEPDADASDPPSDSDATPVTTGKEQ